MLKKKLFLYVGEINIHKCWYIDAGTYFGEKCLVYCSVALFVVALALL